MLSMQFDVETPAVVNKGDELSGGKFIRCPMIARSGGYRLACDGRLAEIFLSRAPL